MIIWGKELSTGSETLDQQHLMLINHINQLGNLSHATNPTRGEFESMVHLVEYLESYADFHFKGEEKCMESHQCPAHAENQQEHERFRGFIRDYKRQCEIEGFKIELIRSLHGVMQKWIQEHILKIDIQLRTCLRK